MMNSEKVIATVDEGRRDEVLKCLYGLSGPQRDLNLSEPAMKALRKLILSTDEEISWRAIFLLGLVWADLSSLSIIIQRLSRSDEDDLVFAAGIDAIFVMAKRNPHESFNSSIDLMDNLARGSRSTELVQRAWTLKKFLLGEIDEKEYRSKKA